MAELLWIKPEEITSTTLLGGDVDEDKYTYVIFNTQIMTLEPLLGSELYNKIGADIEANTLTGLYETLYNDYAKPILKYKSVAEYISISNFMLVNGGLMKHVADNEELPTTGEVETLSNKYDAIAQMYIDRFDKWMCNNGSDIPEYKTCQDDVNATKDLNIQSGWHL